MSTEKSDGQNGASRVPKKEKSRGKKDSTKERLVPERKVSHPRTDNATHVHALFVSLTDNGIMLTSREARRTLSENFHGAGFGMPDLEVLLDYLKGTYPDDHNRFAGTAVKLMRSPTFADQLTDIRAYVKKRMHRHDKLNGYEPGTRERSENTEKWVDGQVDRDRGAAWYMVAYDRLSIADVAEVLGVDPKKASAMAREGSILHGAEASRAEKALKEAEDRPKRGEECG